MRGILGIGLGDGLDLLNDVLEYSIWTWRSVVWYFFPRKYFYCKSLLESV